MQEETLSVERNLLLAVATGDQKAFTRIVDSYWNQVYNHSLAYTKSAGRAQEITQDVFLKLWNKRNFLPEVNDFKNYLFILGRNQIISSLRIKLEDPPGNDPVEEYHHFLTPDHQLEYKEVYKIIQNGIEKLPPVRKAVFKLSRMDGLSYDEIAQQQNISKNTVKEHIVHALNFLRTYVHTHGDLFPLFILGFSL